MDTVQLPRRPERFSAGDDLAVGVCHVQHVGATFTICRTVGPLCWYPLTTRNDPAWRTWSTFETAQAKINQDQDDLSDYPFWGR